ncbi:hypothetical protein AVEN_77992-1 [Araneus ventricosus]|uniref:Mos1 transposase HTH domain-containing protein n=1 Tax=Araneus ventricosus TaxID=182803 RepID=A0A4Y2MF93_ARAVE|nr:hypothetical protein AVEN_77992-1 [Araneus ventricosus]
MGSPGAKYKLTIPLPAVVCGSNIGINELRDYLTLRKMVFIKTHYNQDLSELHEIGKKKKKKKTSRAAKELGVAKWEKDTSDFIRFLHAEGSNAAEIHRRMSKVYGETFMSDSKVRKGCRNFDAGRTDVHDAGGQERKPVSTDDLVQRVDQAIREIVGSQFLG